MPRRPSAAKQSRLPDPSSKNQNLDVDDQDQIQEPLDAEDAGSVDSDKTIDIGPEGLLRQAEDYRQHIVELGGRPTRPIAEYSREVEEKRILLDPRDTYTPEEAEKAYHQHYCRMEMWYFSSELRAWEKFMRWFRRKWVQQNEAAGGSLPTPPPVYDINPLDLQIQYLGYLLICWKEGEDPGFERTKLTFQDHEQFLEHVVGVEKHVAELFKEQGPQSKKHFQERLGHCAQVLTEWELGHAAGFEEQMRAVEKKLTAIRAPKNRSSGVSGFIFLQQPPESPVLEPQLNESKRKRQIEDDSPEPGSITKSQSVDYRGGKRRKRELVDVELRETAIAKRPTQTPREKTSGKTRDNDTQHKLAGLEDKAAEPGRESKSNPKRGGRPRKQVRSLPTVDSEAHGNTESSQKRRKKTLDSSPLPVPEPPASAKPQDRESEKKNPAVVGTQNRMKATSDSGLRRSSRIAEQSKKKKG